MKIEKKINRNIFREYDIRGLYPTDINENVSYTIGCAYGTYLSKLNETMCLVGHDNRLSSDSLNNALISGILSAGVNVVDLGLITTPMLYFARIKKNITPGIMITASHNPKDDNGFKFSFNEFGNAKGEEIYKFRDFIYNGEFVRGEGKLYRYNIKNEYFDLFLNNLKFGNRRVKVVLDCANGITSLYAKELYSLFPVDLVMLYDKSDGNFPNHHPDPIEESNLSDLKKKVIECNADVGISFDGDGDRAGFVYENGLMMSSSEYAVIVIRNLFENSNNKKALYDIKCSNIINEEIIKLGGTAYENRTGASYMMSSVKDNDVLFGIEYSGHIYFNNNFPPITSGLYAGLKLLEIMSNCDTKLSDMINNVNKYYSRSEKKYEVSDEYKFKVVENIKQYCLSKKYSIKTIDGVKIYFSDGWALVRCSNTGPNITTRFEFISEERLIDVENEFDNLINRYIKSN